MRHIPKIIRSLALVPILLACAPGQAPAAPTRDILRLFEYDAGHALNEQAVKDRHEWLAKEVGLK